LFWKSDYDTDGVDIASEFRYRDHVINEKTLVIFISQSGETADTLAALRLAKQRVQKLLQYAML
jgi:glucosamine--fructose-6-phosphate aminotransferase (isomerizing)